MSLRGKVAIVTGGNSGIGEAIVLAFARRGADVVIDYVAPLTRPRTSFDRSRSSVSGRSGSTPT